MASKPIDLPPVVARAFIKDMRASFAENDAIKRDEIAARQLRALRDYNPPRAKSPAIRHRAEFHLQRLRQAGRRGAAGFQLE
jgi:hypothetical protein